MATKSESTYLGELRTLSKHLRSGSEIITDAPTDNHGKGEAFSPTDLTASSLLTCMLTVMGIHANKNGLHMGELSGTIEKHMTAAPRRIESLKVEIQFKGSSLSKAERTMLENIAINCPVALSLHPDVVQQVAFKYQ